jgi:DNA-3-methyladenine glycosylase
MPPQPASLKRSMIRRAFFQRDPQTCARELVGCALLWESCAGIVVETEAYSVKDDEACHTFMRPSARSFVERHEAGAAYVYLNYGMHWLLNVLVKHGGEDGFVLIRALEPICGLELMQKRRGLERPESLCSGPGKLAQALGVTRADHGRDLCGDVAHSFRAPDSPVEIVNDVRIGISKAAHLPWRFLLRESRFVSVRAGKQKGQIV